MQFLSVILIINQCTSPLWLFLKNPLNYVIFSYNMTILPHGNGGICIGYCW